MARLWYDKHKIMDLISVRERKISDWGFLTSTWLKSQRKKYRELSNLEYYDSQKERIYDLLKNAHVLVACNPEDENHIYGYIVFSSLNGIPILHWAYTKMTLRRFGVFKKLAAKALPTLGLEPVVCTY